MQIGYLTRDGRFVGLDTYGNLTLFSAYRIDEAEKKTQFLSHIRTLKPEGRVRVSVSLHRDGWAKKGEPIIVNKEMRLYSRETGHILIGDRFKSVKRIRRPLDGVVAFPTYSWTTVMSREQWAIQPKRDSPLVLLIQDASIRACRRNGKHIEAYGTEQKEFSDFSLGKLKIDLDFPSDEEARRFAENFTTIDDPSSLDSFVKLDVDRSRKIVWNKTMKGILALVVLITLLPVAIVIYALLSADINRLTAGLVLGVLIIFVDALALAVGAHANRRDILDLPKSWPERAMNRWGKDFKGHAAGFARVATEDGFKFNPETGDLKELDTFIRTLPQDSFFASFAWAISSYVALAFLGHLGRDVPYEWQYHTRFNHQVLFFPSANYWVSPFAWVQSVWKREPETLDVTVNKMAEELSLEFAFFDLAAFYVTGFIKDEKGVTPTFAQDIKKEATTSTPVSHVMHDNHYREFRRNWGKWQLRFFEIEVPGPRETHFLPLVAAPFRDDAQPMKGTLDGVTPTHPRREDLAIVRFSKYPMTPIGLQTLNYVEVGPGFFQPGQTVEMKIMAVAEKASVASKRIRQTHKDVGDFLAPMEMDQEGLPIFPTVSFLGLIKEVEEDVNPMAGTGFWIVRMDVGEQPFEVIVRKDTCVGIPEKGRFLTGIAWLVAEFGKISGTPTSYIG